MKLGVDISEGLKLMGSSVVMSDDCFARLVNVCMHAIARKHSVEHKFSIAEFGNVKVDALKAGYASLLSLFVEASRHNLQGELFVAVLVQDHNYSYARATYLVKSYEANLKILRAQLSHIGDHPPHIVDASWTLDYCIKDSGLDRVGMLQYLIQLHTETCDNSIETKKNAKIKFVCTLEELQDLVGKLKDAVKHIERLAAV